MKSETNHSLKNKAVLIKKVLRKGLWNSNATILMYHRVIQPEVDSWLLCVSPDHFFQQMEVLKRYPVISMEEFAENIKKNKIPRSLVISFDDGYQDNFLHAKPVLETFNLPATFFIATQFIGQDEEFWTDELEKYILEPGELPGSIHISFDDFHFSWELGKDKILSEAQYQQYKNWVAWDPPPGNRHALYYELSKQVRMLPVCQREKLFGQLADWAGNDRRPRRENLPMTKDELLELSKHPLFEIGAHSVSHPALSSLSSTGQKAEITGSIAWLESLLQKKIKGFAYPHGAYNDDTLEVMKDTHLQYACTTEQKPVDKNDKLFELPRFRIRNWDGKEFKRRIDRWLKFGF